MKKILIININRNPSQEELKRVHRLLSCQSAQVEKLPSVDDEFTPVTECGSSQVFRCLRTELDTQRTPCDSVDGHDAIVYTEFLHHDSPSS